MINRDTIHASARTAARADDVIVVRGDEDGFLGWAVWRTGRLYGGIKGRPESRPLAIGSRQGVIDYMQRNFPRKGREARPLIAANADVRWGAMAFIWLDGTLDWIEKQAQRTRYDLCHYGRWGWYVDTPDPSDAALYPRTVYVDDEGVEVKP